MSSLHYDKPLKFADHCPFLGSNILSTGSDINIRIRKEWTIIDKMSTIWKCDFSGKIKRVLSIYTNWTLTKLLEKNKELHKDNTYCFEQILEKYPKKPPESVKPLTSHLINHSCQKHKIWEHCWRNRTHERNSPYRLLLMHTLVFPEQQKLAVALCRHWIPSGGLTIGIDGESELDESVLLIDWLIDLSIYLSIYLYVCVFMYVCIHIFSGWYNKPFRMNFIFFRDR